MSRSASSQRSSNTTTNINNVLDGGAIKSAFDFAESVSDEAFDVGSSAVKAASETSVAASKSSAESAKSAIDGMQKNSELAFEFGEGLAGEAFDTFDKLSTQAFQTNEDVTKRAMDNLATQNNLSLSALARLQNEAQGSNKQLLDGITSLVKSNNTGGASDVLESNQKVYVAVAVVLLAVMVLLAIKK